MEYPSGSSAVCVFIPYEVLLQSSAQWLLGRAPRRGTAVCGGAAFSLLNDSLHRFPHFTILTFNFHCLLWASTVTHTRKTRRREQRERCREHTDIQCFVHSLYDHRKVRGCSFPAVCSYLHPPPVRTIFFSLFLQLNAWATFYRMIRVKIHIHCRKWEFSLCPLKRDGPTSMTGDVYIPFLFCRWTVEMWLGSRKIRKC